MAPTLPKQTPASTPWLHVLTKVLKQPIDGAIHKALKRDEFNDIYDICTMTDDNIDALKVPVSQEGVIILSPLSQGQNQLLHTFLAYFVSWREEHQEIPNFFDFTAEDLAEFYPGIFDFLEEEDHEIQSTVEDIALPDPIVENLPTVEIPTEDPPIVITEDLTPDQLLEYSIVQELPMVSVSSEEDPLNVLFKDLALEQPAADSPSRNSKSSAGPPPDDLVVPTSPPIKAIASHWLPTPPTPPIGYDSLLVGLSVTAAGPPSTPGTTANPDSVGWPPPDSKTSLADGESQQPLFG